ncbi:protein FAM151B isoform X1 [Eurytemora carolleeae]|uniref:protein FAM151B isoform X1 n=1 Tax=Eurytemora carolleeae TaxID=1294199 RepID=UPI000C764414|nr:protein FAM151B isoform X1 [Eurytemora carolleeae]|eukprot:XP_023348125.1 protein FAM151B-like isoform X1 [Eurytemora affinis]
MDPTITVVDICDRVNVKDFWEGLDENLMQVTWSHATNSIELLDNALKDGTMMIEADVSIGSNGVIIMAHPPSTSSDLTLQNFIKTVINARLEGGGSVRKGIKLDFKFIEAVEPALKLLREVCEDIDFPVWINADIFFMEGASQPVDKEQFIRLAKDYFPNGTLSLGFTTTSSGKYDISNFLEALQFIEARKVTAPVTLPVRACLLARSKPEIIQYFLQAVNVTDPTLTIWSGAEDEVDVDALVDVINQVGRSRIYLDVPEELEKQIEEKSSSSRVTQIIPLPALFLSLLLCFS